jgi:prepilin-type N-terminal cleavage/methylation domain-containing protein
MKRGYSLVELLVAMVATGVVMALLTPMILSSRGMVRADHLRTTVNQSLRGGADLIGSDIRIAGERFPRGAALQLPPIDIVRGTAGAPDELVLRRNLWEGTLPVCESLAQGTTTLPIRVVRDAAWLTTPPGDEYPECGQPVGTDGWPVSLGQIRALADSIGVAGTLRGYLFDPASGAGEFITFEVRNNANTTGQIHRTVGSAYQNAYPLENRPRIYVLEERRYRLRSDVLELVINDDTTAPLRAAADVVDLQVRYVLDDGTTADSLAGGATWRSIRSVELTLATRVTRGPDAMERSLTSRFFPRNILSR